ncbi:hypothetical protein NM688_g3879 [Phlebia brevispora]|uniref:Uncharacterized protein n=1 Tax=Phlebia brevispora TaxID=194682 RepID=A0ACC1T4F9_9APHY|nr:hypothetical protein NM688_g3879 [Phlebia brevispora]
MSSFEASRSTLQRRKKRERILAQVKSYNIDDLSGNLASLTLETGAFGATDAKSCKLLTIQRELEALGSSFPDLHAFESQLLQEVSGFDPAPQYLVFNDVFAQAHARGELHEGVENPQLASHHPDNLHFVLYEQYLLDCATEIQAYPIPPQRPAPHVLTLLMDLIDTEIETLEDFRRDEWYRRWRYALASRSGHEGYVDMAHYFTHTFDISNPGSLLIHACQVIALMLYLLFGLPRRPVQLLLAGTRDIVRLSFRCFQFYHPSATSVPPVWDSIPRDLRTILTTFTLDPVLMHKVSCPECCIQYDKEACPELCSNQETPSSAPCGAKLWRTRAIGGNSYRQPVLQYHHQVMKMWVARLLSRPGVEDLLEQAIILPEAPRVMKDFWDGSAIRAFKGPAGHETFYMDASHAAPRTLRLIFVFAGDGFNPFHTKAGKGSSSTLGMYMICLNLPPHLRYLPENMYFVGAIPGKPSATQINHFLRLLVDDLLPFWEPGIYFSRTAKCDIGRLVNAVVIPLVADMLGIRQFLAFGGVTSHFFCSYCHLDYDDIENIVPDTWRMRVLEDHRKLAEMWRDAPSVHDRETLFATHGVRWTELLRLPYWNPFEYAVIDPMHNQFLGLLEDHCREIWGMNTNAPDGLGYSDPNKIVKLPQNTAMKLGLYYLHHGTESQLDRHSTAAVLWHLCIERGLRRGTKRRMLTALMAWREREGFPVPTDQPPPRKDGKERASQGVSSVMTATAASNSRPRTSAQTERASGHEFPIALAAHGNLYERAEKAYRTGRTASYFYRGYRKDILKYMCIVRGLSEDGTVKTLADRLVDYRDRHDEPLESLLPLFEPGEPDPSSHSSSRTQPLAPNEHEVGGTTIVNHVQPRGETDGQLAIDAAYTAEGSVEAGVSPRVLPDKQDRNRAKVLGKETLAVIHMDAERTLLPSWVSRAPKGFGSTKCGKLSADQWRTVCTIHLPVTLIRLWGTNREDPDEDRKKRMLRNYMDLVSAVNIAGMMVMTEEHIKLYETTILRYLHDLKNLYHEAAIKPNHHLAVHLALFLRRFGPVHSWRAYAFERFNYLLQQVNTNNRMGDLELTFMNQVCRAANLRHLLHDTIIQEAIEDVITAYNGILREDGRGTRLADNLRLVGNVVGRGSDSHVREKPLLQRRVKLSRAVYDRLVRFLATESDTDHFASVRALNKRRDQEFLSEEATQLKKLLVGGVTYKPFTESQKDSHILTRLDYTLPDEVDEPDVFPPSGLYAARIEQLISHQRRAGDQWIEEQFIVVKKARQLDAAHISLDPYRIYGHSGGFLCYDDFLDDFELIRSPAIVCHVARTTAIEIPGIEAPCVHVLPLDRMMQLAPIHEEIHTGEGPDMDLD